MGKVDPCAKPHSRTALSRESRQEIRSQAPEPGGTILSRRTRHAMSAGHVLIQTQQCHRLDEAVKNRQPALKLSLEGLPAVKLFSYHLGFAAIA